MNDTSNRRQAIELLQKLGLKEYEARCFVALSQHPQATAKEISETSEVPRTRVYDAIRVLESKGLVEVQHASPKQFRAVSVDEAVETLRSEYESRTEALRETLEGMEPPAPSEGTNVTHEVWALSGRTGIESRVRQLLGEAESEIIVVVGDETVVTDALIDRLRAAADRGVDVVVGVQDEAMKGRFGDDLSGVQIFVSGIDWLGHSAFPGDDTEIGRLLLIDQSTILVSSLTHHQGDGHNDEQAVFGRGFDNGLVAIVRRLMATGFREYDTVDVND